MTSNYVVSVPKLKGRENYQEWAFAAENFLVLEGTSNSIRVTDPKEAAADAKTKAKLILTIDSPLYVHIKDVTSSKELWDKLKQLFDDSGFTRRISLLRTLISIRLENCTSMTSYVTQIIETSQKLNGSGFNINDEWIGSLLLAGLSEKYSPMIMAIEHSGINITADAIKTKLMDIEEDSGDVSGAFASYHKKKYGNHNSSGTRDRDNMSTSKSKKVIKCYKCKQTGHYRNQCTNVDKDSPYTNSSERKQTNAFSAVFLNGNFSKNDWYIDSGASAHLTANEHWVKNVSNEHSVKEIVVANKEKVPVKCSGDVKITTLTDNCEYDVVVEGVLCVPSLTTNLISVSQLIAKGNRVLFTNDGCQIFNKLNVLVATACLMNGVYKLRMPDELLAAVVTSSDIWHRRLGHVNSNYLNKMQDAVEGLTLDRKADITKSSCTVCCEGKQSRLPFPQNGNRSNDLLQIIHTDVCGPFQNVSIGGSRYFILFVDDYSRMIYIYFMKTKSEAFSCFQRYKALVENELNKKIKILRSDNGKEFVNKEFDNYLSQAGIIHQKSNAYTPEQNGLAERSNRSVVEKARCLLFDAELDKNFWAEAANTAVYLQNRTVASALNGKTPFEMWTGKKPDISHLRVFGSVVMMHIPKEKRIKWDKKAEKGILVGYPDGVKGYRVYIPRTKEITTSRDVIIIEKTKLAESAVQIEDKAQSQIDSTGDSVGDTSGDSGSEEFHDGDDTYLPDEESSVSSVESVVNVEKRCGSCRNRKQPDRYGFSNVCVGNSSIEDSCELSIVEALKGPEKEQWLEAVRDELQCFDYNNAWELTDLPKDSTIVQCRWVLRKKYDSENNVRYRARLVAKGFSQKQGVDYTETFSPVVRHTTLRLLFSLSVQLGLDVTHLDVKTAFLNGDLEETIYMQKPDCYNSPGSANKVLKLKKAIYGLKQASRAWNKKVDSCLLDNGYLKSKLEPCMYTKMVENKKTIVTVYVDDFFIFSNDKKESENLKEVLSSQFQIKDLGQVKQCLGMNVKFNKLEGSVTLDQESYIDTLLQKFNMTDCKTYDTPMETKLNVNMDQKLNDQVPFQQLIGSLMYLSVLTRPDITYSVSYLSQFNNCHTDEHWHYAKRVLKYLKKTKSFGIKYCKNGNSEIKGFADADWANDSLDRRSYTGFCFLLSNGIISWESRKQKTVALSSCEAEYMSISEACKEAIYLRALQFEITSKMYTLSLFNDNQSAQKLSTNPVLHKKSKHIDVKYHFARECVSNNIVKLHYLPTANMPADLLTKSLCAKKHYTFLDLLGVMLV